MTENARKLRVPVTLVQGQWELSSGGLVPAMNGTQAELVLAEDAISDAGFLNRYRQRSHIKILPAGTPLLACLNVKKEVPLSDSLARYLIDLHELRGLIDRDLLINWSSVRYSFVQVVIGSATPRQARTLDMFDGGLWLTISGNKADALTTSQIRLPPEFAPDHASSLNHAFTRLSEAYEPWRMAHTGSVYDRYLYQEADGRWYPLKLLRDASLAKEEQVIAYDLWKQFLAKMSKAQ